VFSLGQTLRPPADHMKHDLRITQGRSRRKRLDRGNPCSFRAGDPSLCPWGQEPNEFSRIRSDWTVVAAPVVTSDDDDEPTRIIADYGTAGSSSTGCAPENPVAEIRHEKPPPPIRQHASNSESQLPTQAMHMPSEPEQVAEATQAAAPSSSGIELPANAVTTYALEPARPLPSAPVAETPPPANDYPEHIGVQSTSPTARDVSVEAIEPEVSQMRPRRRALLLSVGLGGAGVALGLALPMRAPSSAPTQAAAAIPVAAVAASPNQSTTRDPEALPATEALEQPISGRSAEPANPKPMAAAARAIELESATPTAPPAQVTKPIAQEPEEEPADEEEALDAREVARAVDDAAERASACRLESDPSGVAVVTITFAPSGRVTTATLAGPPFLGTPTGSCIASTMRSARVSAFTGKHMTVRKTVTIH